ncbi:MAG: YbgC/FadM family acyl-CoA thioesterase [Nitrospirae bacterium]|nr:YbgC/FadM family acyl-CoA thioesterase [Nitrospirota bacterium]MCL5978368.1 YbgC/FadM family acyl-CoA thioesterase [Nitrospirota bacterium]
MAHEIKLKIYYEDTDAGGVVYYANYLRYMERARTEFLAGGGINVAAMHNEGYFFVVAHVDIHYKRSARLGDVITITTEITELKNASMIIKHQVLKEDTLIAEALVTLACIDRDGKPTRFPEGFKNLG